MENKKNDWFASLLYQPDYSLEQFKDIGITPENTSFRSRDEYKNIEAVREAFTKDDKFDEKAFNSFYDSALLLYNDYANKIVENKIASSYEYDPWEWRKGSDAKTAEVSPVLGINPNPWRETTGIKGLNLSTESQFSVREIAQDQKYFDVETGEWADVSPNDFAGVFKSFSAPTLVLATYDEDTEEVINGKKIVHPKGSYKTNAYGAPYYETLGGREIYDKDVLHVTDIFSVDGSKWNKFDFFDADSIETEPWKVVAKNIVRIAPFLIPGNVGVILAGISAAESLLEFMPTFLKAVDGMVTDDAMGNSFGRKMNQYEAWFSRLDYSVSDASRERLVTFENIGKMFGDVSAQLFQQRAVAQIPKLFKNPNIANNQKLGRALSYSYMSATSAQEAYSIFKQAGANDTTSGLAMLALMGAYYKLMSSDYFKDVLFKGTWLDETQYKEKTWAVIQDFQQAIAKGDVPIVDNPKHAAETVKWFQKAFEKMIQGAPVTGKNFMQASLSEGVEEVMEEVGIDVLKGTTAGLKALGIPVAEGNLDFGFGIDDVTKRYLTSFVGGAFGGAVFHGYNLRDPNYRASKQITETPEGRMSELIYLITSGKTNDIYKYAAKLHNRGLLGSNDLAGTKFETVDGINGLEQALVSSENEMSQNDFVYNEFVKQIKYIETILSDEGFIKRRDEIAKLLNLEKDAATVATLGNGAGPFAMNASNLILKDLNRLGTQIVQTRAKIDELVATLKPQGDTAYDKAEFEKALKDNEQYKSYLDELKRLRAQRDEIYDKKNISKYMTQASIILNNDIMKALRGFATINDFTMFKYGKPYSEFTPIQQANIKVEYDSYTNGESDMPFEIGEIYRVLSEQLSSILEEKEEKYSKLGLDTSVGNRTLGNDYVENIKTRINLKKQYDALNQKEEKTPEDLEQKANLEKLMIKLDAAIEELRENPAFSTSLFSETPLNFNSLEEGAEVILNHYNGFRGKLKTDDTELNDFYTEVRSQFQRLNLNRIIETWLGNQDYLYDDMGSLNPEYENVDFYDSIREHPTRDEFVRLLKDLYSNIGVDNKTVFNDYNAIVTLLKEKVGLDDNQIKELLFNDIPDEITVKNSDGTETKSPIFVSLLPRFGKKTLFDFISEIDDIRKDITYSDVSDIIKRFALNIGDNDLISILDLIVNEEKNITNSPKLDSYVISNSTILEQLKKAKMFLESIDAAIAGSYNGLNNVINGYRNKENKTPLAEISEVTAKTLHNNLEILKNRINFIIDLHDINSGQKLRIQKEIGVNMRVKFLKELSNEVYLEEFNNHFKKDGVSLDIAEIISDATSDDFDFDKITTDNFDKYESQIIKAETAIYDAVKSFGFTDDEIIEGLVAVYGPKSLWKQRSSKLTSNKDVKLTDYDLVLYAASIMSLNSNDFTVKYRDAIKELLESDVDDSQKLVPVYGQEYALKLAYAFVHNKDLFNSLMDEIGNTYAGSEEYIEAKKDRILHNVLSVFGGAGTGKTRGVAFLLSRLFDNAEFRFIAPTEKQTNTLLSVFGREGKTEEALTFDSWFAKYAPGIDSIDNVTADKNGVINIKENKVNPIEWFSTDASKTRVIVIDEAGLLNSVQLKAVSDYAEQLGIFVITLGDFKQNSGIIRFKNNDDVKTDADSFEETIGIKTPTLVATFRAANSAKAHNYERMDSVLSMVDDKVKDSDVGVESSTRDSFLNDAPAIQLDYYIDDSEIFGDYVTNNNGDFKNLLDKVLDHGYSILVITDDETEKKYVDPKYDGKVEFWSAKEAQGGEFDYVFVDKSIPDSKFAALQDLYTTSQRARLGSIILDTNSFYKNDLKVISSPNRSSSLPYDMTADQKAEFATWRLHSLEGLVPTENFDNNIALPTNTKINDGDVKVKNNDGETKSDNPESPEQEKDPEHTEGSGDPVENPEEIPEPKKPEPIRSVIPLKDATEPREFKLNPFVENSTSFEERLDEREPEIKSERGFTRIDNFYNYINTQEFYDSEKSNPDSILAYIADNGINLDKDQYLSLMRFTNKIILNNRSFQQALNNRELTITGLNLRNTNKLVKLLSDPKNNYVVWSLNRGENSLLSLRISDEVGKTLGFIPFGITYGLPTGSFTEEHKFRRISKPYFNKGKFMTIAALKTKYPWLNISYRGGIVINSDDIQGGNFNDRTKEYAKINNGKGMAFGYDIATVDQNEILKLSEAPDGTMWLHNQRDDVDAFGVQKQIDSKELASYSIAIYWLNRMYDNGNKKHLISELKQLGIIDDSAQTDKDITKQVCSYLQNITGNNDWNNSILQSAKFNNEYFEKLKELNDASELISYIQTNRMITDMLGSVLNGSEDLNINNLFSEFSKTEYINKDNRRARKNKAIHLDFNGDNYMLRVSKFDSQGRPTRIGIFEFDEKNRETYGDALFEEALRIGTFQESVKTLITKLMSRYNSKISDFNSTNVRASVWEESWENDNLKGFYKISAISSFYTVFGANLVADYTKILDPAQFKYGIYGNIKRGPVLEGTQLAPFNVKEDYITNATEWHGGIYSYSEDQFVPGQNDLDNDNRRIVLDTLNERLESLYDLVENDIDSDIWNNLKEELLSEFKSQNVNDYDLDQMFEAFVDKINSIIVENTTDRITTVYEYVDGELKQNSINTEENAYSNLIKQFGVTGNENVKIYSWGNINVVRNGDRTFVLFTNSDGKLLIRETKTFDAWKSAKDALDRIDESTDGINPKIKVYLDNLLTDTVTDENIDNYKNAIKYGPLGAINTSISRAVNAYLEERLKTEEC